MFQAIHGVDQPRQPFPTLDRISCPIWAMNHAACPVVNNTLAGRSKLACLGDVINGDSFAVVFGYVMRAHNFFFLPGLDIFPGRNRRTYQRGTP